MKILITLLSLIFSTQFAFAKQSTQGLNIATPKDALLLISTDKFGSISLTSFIHDIKNNAVYRERTKYSTGYVAIQSQNDVGHYGDLDFEFKPPFNFTKQDIIAQSKKIIDVKVTEAETRVHLGWEINELKCSLDFDSDPKYALFIYLCHYDGK